VSSREGQLRLYLISDYDDPDTEPELTTSSVRTQILQAVARLSQGQDDLRMKMLELEVNQKAAHRQRLNALRGTAGGGRRSPAGAFR